MKSTFSLFSTSGVKTASFALLFLISGWFHSQAQSYKPLDQAVASVQSELDAITSNRGVFQGGQVNPPGSVSVSVGTGGNESSALAMKVVYLKEFLNQVKALGPNATVAGAVQQLDEVVSVSNTPEPHKVLLLAARNSLIELITL